MTKQERPGSVEGITDHRYTPYGDLRNSTVFITGGGTGIGAYFVYAFASIGAKVAFVSMSEDKGHALCNAVYSRTNIRPLFEACDIRDIDKLQNTVRVFLDKLGMISILINNAARDDRHNIDETSKDQWDDLLNVNLRPHFFSVQSVVAGMRTLRNGSIINVGSNSANLGLAGYPAYVASKAGIIGLTRGLARELGPDGIRVNALIPGWVLTERQRALWVTQAALDACLEQQSLKVPVRAESIAEAALFLASGASSMITGQSLIVDGGRAMG